MKKHSRLYLAALLFLCTLIPYLLLGNEQKSEALRFFESFVDPSDLSIDENGSVYFHCKTTPPQTRLALKYADQLEFDPNKSLSIDNITIDPQDPHGIMWFEATLDPSSAAFYPEHGCRLLKHLDGVWYQISTESYGLDPPWFLPGFTTPLNYYPFTFFSYEYGRIYYTLPSGKYYLYIPAALPTESEGKITGHGAGMVEIKLRNLDRETKRFTERQTIYINGHPQTDPEAFPKYTVTVLGETLHHDPYA